MTNANDEGDPYRYFDSAKFREDDRCKRCGRELNGEAAWVNGEVWCHPCADEVAAVGNKMKELLDFDDAGANDGEPVKGVTVGDIRAWHDRIEELEAALRSIANKCPATCELTLAHEMADEAIAVLDKDAGK